MNRTLFALGTTAILILANAGLSSSKKIAKTTSTNPKIQMALLLDTSNSMDGLIEQSKSQLWKMVNELADSKKDGKSPDLEIALYEYGNDNLSIKGNYLKQVLPLTNDLDEISEQLFQLKTNGGSEYCGAVILDAVLKLDWSPSDDDLNLIVISGNEPFDQGPVTPQEACLAALKKGISIITIFCGNWKEGMRTGWADGAKCAEGEYLNIDSDEKIAHIPTPYDEEIVALNSDLNGTYISYGREGRTKIEAQKRQDTNAAVYSLANVRQRASFKSKSQYTNSSWDLVDRFEIDEEALDDLDEKYLPKELKGKDKLEIKQIVKAKKEEREKIKSKIQALEKKANEYESKEKAKLAGTQKNTLDQALQKSISNLAKKKGYDLK